MAYENSPILIDETPGIKHYCPAANLAISLIATDPIVTKHRKNLQKNL